MLLILDCLRSAVLGEELQSELLDGLHGYDVQDPHIHASMPRDEGVEVMCTISLSPLDAAMMRQRLDEMGDSVIMSQVGGAADATGQYRWRVHVHVLDADPAVALIRSLGVPTDISVSELAVPRDPQPQAATVAAATAAASAVATAAPAAAAETRNPDGHAR
jgi:dihydroxyacetone kinase-like predicted kinase